MVLSGLWRRRQDHLHEAEIVHPTPARARAARRPRYHRDHDRGHRRPRSHRTRRLGSGRAQQHRRPARRLRVPTCHDATRTARAVALRRLRRLVASAPRPAAGHPDPGFLRRSRQREPDAGDRQQAHRLRRRMARHAALDRRPRRALADTARVVPRRGVPAGRRPDRAHDRGVESRQHECQPRLRRELERRPEDLAARRDRGARRQPEAGAGSATTRTSRPSTRSTCSE